MRELVAALAASAAVTALAAGAEAAPDCKSKELTIGTLNPAFIRGPAVRRTRPSAPIASALPGSGVGAYNRVGLPGDPRAAYLRRAH
jgi:hypothetical protein